MAFQTIIEFVAHGLEGMGIVVVGVGGLVAYDWLLDRDVPLRLRSARKYPDGVVRLRCEARSHGSLRAGRGLAARAARILRHCRRSERLASVGRTRGYCS